MDNQETGYKNSLHHLQEELKRIDLLIFRQIQNFRGQKETDISEPYKGLFISEDEIDTILNQTEKPDKEAGTGDPGNKNDTDFDRRLEKFNTQVSKNIASSLEKGTYLSLVHLSHLFYLNPFEINCLLICFTLQLDLKYERLYAYLQNDVTRKNPSVHLVMKLLCRSMEEKIAARTFFSPHGPLIKYHLLEYVNGLESSKPPLLARPLNLDDRIAGFLLESRVMDSRLIPFVHMTAPAEEAGDLLISGDTREKINRLNRVLAAQKKGEGFVFCLKGPPGNGQKQVAEFICKKTRLYLLVVDMETVETGNFSPDGDVFMNLLLREALLQSAALYFKGCRFLEDPQKKYHKHLFLRAVGEFRGLVFLETNQNLTAPFRAFGDSPNHFLLLEFSIPSYQIRKHLWDFLLNGTPLQEDLDTLSLAGKFRFSEKQIRDAVKSVRDMALLKENPNGPLSEEDIHKACRFVSNQRLSTLAGKIKPRYNWKDIILPHENFTRLKEIAGYVRQRHVVYGEWGFGKKLSLGKGLNALFHGSSGTGKTMAAEVIAKDLGLDLYKIDLSCVMSKYIGETEKNLSEIFKEAETSNSIIFFDEADALFGKRSKVKDAHDRYANIEVAYLLQKMEEYDGIVILATNLLKNIDDAFVRRMHFSLDFPFPDATCRLKIWQTIFPEESPREKDIDFEFLARKFKVSGGNIKNIVLTAAFFAAESSSKIGMKHMILASKREFQKIGKLHIQSDFGKYFPLTLA
jgi:hypothetical protein